MAKIHEVEVFECPECAERGENPEHFRKTIFICDNCDSEYDEAEAAKECCTSNAPGLESDEQKFDNNDDDEEGEY